MIQKKKLKQWMGTTRFVYNSSLAYLRDEEKRISNIKNTSTNSKEETRIRKEQNELFKNEMKSWKDNLKDELKQIKIKYKTNKQECKTKSDIANKKLEYVKQYEKTEKDKLKKIYLEQTDSVITKNKIRDKFVTAKNNEWFSDKKWMSETPKDIRAGAVEDLMDARNVAFINKRKGNIKKFHLNFRKKGEDKSIKIPSSAIKVIKYVTKTKKTRTKISVYSKSMKPLKCCLRDKALKNLVITSDCRLGFNGKKWYLYVPVTFQKDNFIPQNETVGIDPGIRKIYTLFGEDKVTMYKFDKDKLRNTQLKLDNFQSLKDTKKITKNTYKKCIEKIYTKLDNLIDDIHYKIVSDTTKTYKSIFLPNFKSQEIVKIIRDKQTKRNLFCIKHFLLRKRFIEKTQRMTYSQTYICTEEYTTQQCPMCENLTNIGSSETYVCKTCKFTIDRDINSGRNITIKTFSEN